MIGSLRERFTISPTCEFTVEGRLYAFDDGDGSIAQSH